MASISFDMIQQERNLWCFAAVAVSVDKYSHEKLNTPSSGLQQCDLKGRQVTPPRNCCAASGDQTCLDEGSLAQALIDIDRLGDGPLGRVTLGKILGELGAQKPVCVRMESQDNRAHFAVIFAATPAGRLKIVEPGSLLREDIAYDAFKNHFIAFQKYQWTNTYFVKGSGTT